MTINYYCRICNDSKFDHRDSVYFDQIPQNLILEAKCSKGHLTLIRLSNPLFTLLYDNAIKAYVNKNYRGCIFEAASATERFYEQAIRLFLIGKENLENKKLIEDFHKAWKIIKNHSERQVGAFIMLFFSLTNRSPILLTDKLVALRNNTIHKGHFPTEEEAYNFLAASFDVIQGNRFIIGESNNDVFWLLDQRIDFENYINPVDINGKEMYILDFNGAHFFNSSFGDSFQENIVNYYKSRLSNNG